jgi:hypothetical protein
MQRAVRTGGTVAAYVWDYADGMQLLRRFWDAAVALDPAAGELDEGRRFPLCRREALRSLLNDVGLEQIEVRPIDVPTVFKNFEDYWSPFLGGQGPAPGYCVSLSDDRRARLRNHLHATLPVASDASYTSRPVLSPFAESSRPAKPAGASCPLYPQKRTSLSAARIQLSARSDDIAMQNMIQLAATHPPSTNSVCPVTKSDAGLER